jgi:hypothetical protein
MEQERQFELHPKNPLIPFLKSLPMLKLKAKGIDF